MNDLMWNKAIELVKQKYGKNLIYKSIKLVGDVGQDNSQPYYFSGDDLVIPLKNENSTLGDIVVTRGLYLSAEEKYEIVNMIKNLFKDQLVQLKPQPNQETAIDNISNVIAFSSKQKKTSLRHEEPQRKQTLSKVLLLKSHTEMSRTKVALKIHEMTQRNLLVRLNDIMNSIETASDFKSLDDVTIYIENIELVPEADLNKVQDYLQKEFKSGPLFLIGSTLSPEAIMNTNWKASFQNDLLGFYFDIDRVPLSQQTSAEILELLFFQLDAVLT